jgi:pimeloyl-ACP methyl ester carboxylesterase
MTQPIVLLHGALGSSSQLEPLKKMLVDKGRKVYSLNFSGHSGKPFLKNGFGIDVFAHDVLQFLDDEKIDIADLLGYSMGGYVALWLAHQHPKRVNRIITLGTKFDWSPESAEREIKKLDPEKIQTKIPAFARILEHRHAPNNWKELINKTAVMMHELGQKSMLTEEIFPSLHHKIHILLGDQDDMADRVYSERVAGWLPNGVFQLLVNTPHPIEKVNLERLLDFTNQSEF